MDASASARARGLLDELRRQARPAILMVDHGGGGGVERHIVELAQAVGADAAVLRLKPAGEGHVALELPGATLWFDAARDWEALCRTLAGVGIDRVHVHHVHGLPAAVLDLPRRLGAPHWITLHDFFPACPAYHLKDASLRFCGGGPGCRKCLDGREPAWGITIDEWRARFAAFLSGAERVVSPSADAAARLREFFPGASPVVWPHASPRAAPARRPVRVLVPGAISAEKGLDVLEACVADALARRLPLHFHVVGFLGRPLAQWPHAPLTVSGEYAEGRLPELLALDPGDAFLFLAQVPETFSYTLSAALAADRPIVATDLGAFRERLEGVWRSRLLPWDSPPAAFNQALLELCPVPDGAASPPPDEARAYAERYLRGLSRGPRPAEMPPLEERWLSPPARAEGRRPLAWLHDDGVVAGKAASREALRRGLAQADRELEEARAARQGLESAREAAEARAAALEAQVEAARAAAQRAEAQATGARARLAALEASRSWRLAAPIRALARWLGITRM